MVTGHLTYQWALSARCAETPSNDRLLTIAAIGGTGSKIAYFPHSVGTAHGVPPLLERGNTNAIAC